jgi:hypothetical protein
MEKLRGGEQRYMSSLNIRTTAGSKRRGHYLTVPQPFKDAQVIFVGSDFHDFYTIKSLWDCDFRVKINKKNCKNI